MFGETIAGGDLVQHFEHLQPLYKKQRYIPFYSEVIDASVREATFVLDELLHNEVIKSTIHTTWQPIHLKLPVWWSRKLG